MRWRWEFYCIRYRNCGYNNKSRPNEDSPVFYDRVADTLEELGNDTCIICGDFNLVQDQGLDTKKLFTY